MPKMARNVKYERRGPDKGQLYIDGEKFPYYTVRGIEADEPVYAEFVPFHPVKTGWRRVTITLLIEGDVEYVDAE